MSNVRSNVPHSLELPSPPLVGRHTKRHESLAATAMAPTASHAAVAQELAGSEWQTREVPMLGDDGIHKGSSAGGKDPEARARVGLFMSARKL